MGDCVIRSLWEKHSVDGFSTPTAYKAVDLQADICCRELLLEIEATASFKSGRND